MRAALVLPLCLALAACAGGGAPVTSGTGAALAPGQIGRSCGLGRTAQGTEVARFPAEGRAQWRIHDTAPGSTAPRTQYITGFSDGCPRQVTAALVVFGSPAVHEALRYDAGNTTRYSATDAAYERIKATICGVRPRARCPSDRLVRLESRAAFVTIYPTFGGTGRQVELLLDGGDVLAESRAGI